jgi:response regulator NasT
MNSTNNQKQFSRLAQIAHKKLSVMLVDDQPARAALLEQALLDNGYHVIAKLATAAGLMLAVNEQQPDIIIVDVDSPDRDMLEQMTMVSNTNAHPIVMFAEQDVPQTLQRAIGAGVSVYVVDGLQPQLVKSIIEVAIARFREYQALRNELEHTRTELADRKVIDRAKGLLMSHRHFSEEEAYKAMRKMSMDKGQRLITIANNIIDIFELLECKTATGELR